MYDTIRTLILIIGWPILIAGTLYLYYNSYKFYLDVQKNVWGKLVLTMVSGWLITMYSLGLVSTIFLFNSPELGTKVVLPIFMLWFVTMVLIVRIVMRWNREAVEVNKFNQKLQSLVEERTKDLSTEKIIAEAERNKLKVVIASINDGIIALDSDRRIILANKAIKDITGYDPDSLIGKKIPDVLTFYEEDKKLTTKELCVIGRENFEGVLLHKDNLRLSGSNTEKKVTMNVSQITEAKEVNLGCIMTLHDTTKEQEVEEMKLDFVSMAAHELRTPLTSIRGYVEILKDDFSHSLDEAGKTYLNRLSVSSENLGSLIDNMLNVSRIEKNIFKIDVEKTDIVPVIKNTIDGVRQQADAKKQRIVFEPPASFPLVIADSFRIAQVMTNLLSNAINYTNTDGTISISLAEEENQIKISVTDNGQGIPKEAQPRLFTKFFRVSGPLDRGSKGTGLGLYISKTIIEMHNGKITLNSEVGRGTTFSFTLPKAI